MSESEICSFDEFRLGSGRQIHGGICSGPKILAARGEHLKSARGISVLDDLPFQEGGGTQLDGIIDAVRHRRDLVEFPDKLSCGAWFPLR